MSRISLLFHCTPGLEEICHQEIREKFANIITIDFILDGIVCGFLCTNHNTDNTNTSNINLFKQHIDSLSDELKSIERISLFVGLTENIPLKHEQEKKSDRNDTNTNTVSISNKSAFDIVNELFQPNTISTTDNTTTTNTINDNNNDVHTKLPRCMALIARYMNIDISTDKSVHFRVNCIRRFPLIQTDSFQTRFQHINTANQNNNNTSNTTTTTNTHNINDSNSNSTSNDDNKYNFYSRYQRVIEPKYQLHSFKSPQIESIVAHNITRQYTNFSVNFKLAKVEFVVNIIGNLFLFSINLRSDLHRRDEFYFEQSNSNFTPVTRLNPSTSYCLARLSGIGSGQFVYDCCSGVGTICVQSALYHCNNAYYINSDINTKAIQSLQQYCTQKRKENRAKFYMDNFIGDCTVPSLHSNSIDVILSDLPFGNRCGNFRVNQTLYVYLLRNIARILKMNAFAYLLTADSKLLLREIHDNKNLRLSAQYVLEIGGQRSVLFKIEKISAPEEKLNEVQLRRLEVKMRHEKGKRKAIRQQKAAIPTTPNTTSANTNTDTNTSTTHESIEPDTKRSKIESNE